MIDHRDADLSGSQFRNVDLSGAQIRSAFLNGLVISDAWVEDVRIEGKVVSLEVNGVDVAAYVEAELDRRDPERKLIWSKTVAGLRQGWEDAIARTDSMVERARALPPRLLDEQVNDEFSFIQTLRHLVFGFDRWLTGPVFGDPEPYFHPLGQSHESAYEGVDDGLDPEARPNLDDALAVRAEQRQRLRDFLATTSDEDLRRVLTSPNGDERTVADCVGVVLNEEWWHHQYAARDLSILEQRLT